MENMETDKRGDDILVESTAPATDLSIGSFREVLKNRSFLLLWLAQLISQIGFNAANYGLIAFVTEVTGSTVMVGFAIVSFTLPAVPFSLLAGVYVDYLDKRMVLWACNALRALATVLIVVALLWNPHTVIPLFFLTFLISMITQFFNPAEASAIPLLVGRKDLVPALSLFNITLTIAQAIGFLLLGRLITSFFTPFILPLFFTSVLVKPLDMLFVVVALSYLICTLLIFLIPSTMLLGPESNGWRPPIALGKEMWNIVQRDVRGSWKFIYQDRRLLVALLQGSFVSILLLVIGELAGPFVKNVLLLPVEDLTILFAPAGIGLVLGGLLMPYITKVLGKSQTIALGSVCTAAGLVLLPLGYRVTTGIQILNQWSLFFVGAFAFVLGISLDMVNIPAQTVVQERAPKDERGRIFSFQFMLNNAGSIPVLLFAGAIADTLGIEPVMYLMGGAVLAFQMWVSRYKRRALAT